MRLKRIYLIFVMSSMLVAHAGNMGLIGETYEEGAGLLLGVRVLYLFPYYNDRLFFAGAKRDPFGFIGYVKNTPDPAWSFYLEGGYRFNPNFDVMLNWTHLSNRQGVTHYDEGVFRLPLNLTDLFSHQFTTLIIRPNWEAANGELGYRFEGFNRLFFRSFLGVHYTSIKSFAKQVTLDNNNNVIPSPTPARITFLATNSSQTTFSGWGPRLGIAGEYHYVYGISLFGEAATAVLFGQRSYNANYDHSIISSSTTTPNLFPLVEINPPSQTVTVPMLEAKLAISITYMAQGQWTWDLGWMWANYFNSQQYTNLGDPKASLNTTGFAITGPYAGVRWVSYA